MSQREADNLALTGVNIHLSQIDTIFEQSHEASSLMEQSSSHSHTRHHKRSTEGRKSPRHSFELSDDNEMESSRSVINQLMELSESVEDREVIRSTLEGMCKKYIESSVEHEQMEMVRENKELRAANQELKKRVHEMEVGMENVAKYKKETQELKTMLEAVRGELTQSQNRTIEHTNKLKKDHEEEISQMKREFAESRSKGQQQIDYLLSLLVDKEQTKQQGTRTTKELPSTPLARSENAQEARMRKKHMRIHTEEDLSKEPVSPPINTVSTPKGQKYLNRFHSFTQELDHRIKCTPRGQYSPTLDSRKNQWQVCQSCINSVLSRNESISKQLSQMVQTMPYLQ